MRCSWLHCEASFEGHPVAARHAGWGLVCRHTTTGEVVLVCPDHLQEMLEADLRALERLSKVPVLFEGEEVEVTRRLLKGRILG